MTEYLPMSPTQPDWRQLRQVVEVLNNNGLIVYPTDACYAIGCLPQAKEAIERIYTLRNLTRRHDFTLLCADLKVANQFGHISNTAYRILKDYTPGPYTFIVSAARQVPSFIKELHQAKGRDKTIGLRIPAHPILAALLSLLDQPLLSSTLLLPGHTVPLNSPTAELSTEESLDHPSLKAYVDLIMDAGPCLTIGTTVVDLTTSPPIVVREGAGEWLE